MTEKTKDDHHCKIVIFLSKPFFNFQDWAAAERHCNSLGGNLASITQDGEYGFLRTMVKQASKQISFIGSIIVPHMLKRM